VDYSAEPIDEHPVRFGKTKSLLGVLAVPGTENRVNRTAVILLNSGIIHRVGPGRLYVNLARRLAHRGFNVLRFDLSGIGDSPVRSDNVPFIRSSVEETQDAISFMEDACGAERVVLMGICTGALVSYRTALVDKRVSGTLMINAQGFIPEVVNEISQYVDTRKSARYLFGNALFNPRSWSKFLTGQVDYKTILGALSSRLFGNKSIQAARSPQVKEIAEGLNTLPSRGAELYLFYSEGDPGIDELNLILGQDLDVLRTKEHVRYKIVRGADHMFTLLEKQAEFMTLIENWMADIAGEFDETNEREPALPSA
jgi:pimeloyl-ACP methyl ester carboxylesterase